MSDKYKVLVYYHRPEYLEKYVRLLQEARPDLDLLICGNDEQTERVIDQAEILYSSSRFPVALLPRAVNLKWIQTMTAGVEHFSRSGFIPAGVPLTRTVDVFSNLMSEYVIGYILAITQKMKTVLTNQKKKRWAPIEPDSMRHKTVGLLGLGSIGSKIAYRAHLMGAKVVGLAAHE